MNYGLCHVTLGVKKGEPTVDSILRAGRTCVCSRINGSHGKPNLAIAVASEALVKGP